MKICCLEYILSFSRLYRMYTHKNMQKKKILCVLKYSIYSLFRAKLTIVPPTSHQPNTPQTIPPPSHHARAHRSCDSFCVRRNLLDAERRWWSHSAGAPPKNLPGAPFTKGPFAPQNGRSAKPTVRHLSFSLSKSPKGTLRQRQKRPTKGPHPKGHLKETKFPA
jgi:hypothetical protein